MPPRARTAKYADDPMVKLLPAALRFALDAAGLTASDLARQTKNTQQTISHLTRGEGELRCRRSRLRAMAKALDVPASFLQGEGLVQAWHQPLPGQDYRLTERTRYAASRVLARAEAAIHRDLRQQTKSGTLRDGRIAMEAEQEALDAIAELLRASHWQEMLVELPPKPRKPHRSHREAILYANAPHYGAEAEAHMLAIIRSWDFLLEPWFEGRAQLDYGALRRLTRRPPDGLPARQLTADAIRDGGTGR